LPVVTEIFAKQHRNHFYGTPCTIILIHATAVCGVERPIICDNCNPSSVARSEDAKIEGQLSRPVVWYSHQTTGLRQHAELLYRITDDDLIRRLQSIQNVAARLVT